MAQHMSWEGNTGTIHFSEILASSFAVRQEAFCGNCERNRCEMETSSSIYGRMFFWKPVTNLAMSCGMFMSKSVLPALDCQRLDVADTCIEALNAKFPGSVRVRRLEGMLLEAEGRYEQAREVYKAILDKDDANMFARKRLVAILKAQRKIPEAIEKLNEYLKKFMTDYEGWNELCDMYLSMHDYTNACFCMEELIMSNPHNHLYHQKYADIKYTYGGTDSMEIARTYYAQAVKLCPNNMRATLRSFPVGHKPQHEFWEGRQKRDLLTANTQLGQPTRSESNTSDLCLPLFQAQQPEQQMRETKVLESIEKLLESLQVTN
ncbi:hypothetical protein BaRGS_00030123 [Batillaria attramentaria]|uniref:ER membrane protein complex subunit 2 n=1 Tax=Batillaria attramentaria TaxID=370345 RepID=A0ABD0JVN1_9CAEN